MRRVYGIILVIAFSLFLTSEAFASSKNNAGAEKIINQDQAIFTTEEINKQLEIDMRLRASASEGAARGIVDREIYTAPIVAHKQINTYYCGPASTQMICEGLMGAIAGRDQEWFANQLGTTSQGTSSSQIANTLRTLTGENYSVANVFTTNQTEADFYNNVSNSLKQGCAVVVNVKTIPGRYTSSSGHFMVIHGSFNDPVYGVSWANYTYTDPHYNNAYYGTFTISGSNMFSAVSSNLGNYVRVA